MSLPLPQDPDGQMYDVMRRELTFEAKGKVLTCCHLFSMHALDCCQCLHVMRCSTSWLRQQPCTPHMPERS